DQQLILDFTNPQITSTSITLPGTLVNQNFGVSNIACTLVFTLDNTNTAQFTQTINSADTWLFKDSFSDLPSYAPILAVTPFSSPQLIIGTAGFPSNHVAFAGKLVPPPQAPPPPLPLLWDQNPPMPGTTHPATPPAPPPGDRD